MAILLGTPPLLIRFCIILLGIFNAYITFRLNGPTEKHPRLYSKLFSITAQRNNAYLRTGYRNDDFPSTLDVPGLENKVLLVPERTTHYQLNGTDADEEWEQLLPASARLARLGPNYRPFAVSMLHSLHCLDRLRQSIPNKPITPIGRLHVEHCANYIRESILCAADTQLEPEDGPGVPHICRDWTAVYKTVVENHEAFVDADVDVPY